MPICARSVGNPLDRYDELLAPPCTDAALLKAITAKAGRVLLAIDGLQPDVGHELLWVPRDVISGEVLLARGHRFGPPTAAVRMAAPEAGVLAEVAQ